MLTNETIVYLLKDVYLDYEHQIDFPDLETQYNYFITKPKLTFNNFQYVRANNSLRLPMAYDDLLGYNYLMYKNKGKWYYCFIDSKEFVSDMMTSIFMRTDIIQTYMFEYEVKDSYIDREHQDRWLRSVIDNSLQPKFNDVLENLNYGSEYKVTRYSDLLQHTLYYNNKKAKIGWFLIVSTTRIVDTYESFDPVFKTPTPFQYYLLPYNLEDPKTIFRLQLSGGLPYSLYSINNFLLDYTKTSNILSVSFIPYLPFEYTVEKFQDNNGVDIGITITNNNIIPAMITASDNRYIGFIDANNSNISNLYKTVSVLDKSSYISTNISIDKALPPNINNETKLYTHPYFYMSVTNYQSNPLNVKYEYLGNQFAVKFLQNISPNPKSKFYIESYLGDTDGKERGIINNTINDLALLTDAYKQYMIEHKAAATTGLAVNIGGTLLGATMAAPMTGGLSLVSGGANIGEQIAGEMIKQHDLKNTPDNVRSLGNNIDFDITDDNLFLKINKYEILDTYKYIIFKYFMVYGYKCNEIKIPDVKTRYYFNYIKTIGANIKGNLDVSIINEIKNIYDAGITFWHFRDSATFIYKDYSKENAEMSLI